MTEMLNGMSQGQDVSMSSPVDAPSTSVAPSHTATAEKAERTFSQQQVDDIVKRAKHETIEKQQRLISEQPQYYQEKYGTQASVSTQSHDNNAVTHNDIERVAGDVLQKRLNEFQAQAQEQELAKWAQSFKARVDTGKEKYNDFEHITADMDIGSFPYVAVLASEIDNTADVIYELGKNRSKLLEFQQMYERSPANARKLMGKLSQSIKDNESSSKIRHANEPLSQMRPSNIGTDNGVRSVKDYKLDSRYRG